MLATASLEAFSVKDAGALVESEGFVSDDPMVKGQASEDIGSGDGEPNKVLAVVEVEDQGSGSGMPTQDNVDGSGDSVEAILGLDEMPETAIEATPLSCATEDTPNPP